MRNPDRRKVTAVLISLNERENIAECLRSLHFADEIVVLDSGSTDGTRDIAREFTDRVYQVPWKGFGPQKQAAVDMASHDLVLNVDCDERVTGELADEIGDILRRDRIPGAYTIPRRPYLGGKEIRHSGWYPDRVVRLFDRRNARYSDSAVHERVIVDGEVGRCDHHLLHYSFRGFSHILVKMNRYTDLSARMMFEEGRRCRLSDLTLRPLLTFLKSYVLRAGFLDGVEGLEIAAAGGLHVFAKYVKLRELERHPQ